QRAKLVIGVLFQPAYPRGLLRRLAIECRTAASILQVLADDTGIGQREIPIPKCRNAAKRADFVVPVRLVEWRLGHQFMGNLLLSQLNTDLANEGGENRPVKNQ